MYRTIGKRQAMLLAGVVALLLLPGACAATADSPNVGVVAPTATPPPATQPARSTPVPSPTVLPSPTDVLTSEEQMEIPTPIIMRAQSALADHLGVVSTTLTLATGEAVQWSDSSLGCPAPDQMYLQVITPGYRLDFADAAEQQYAVHTTETADRLILCQDGRPQELE